MKTDTKQDAASLPRNPDYRSMSVFFEDGQRIAVREGSLFNNLRAISRKRKNKGSYAITAIFFKGDVLDYMQNYENRRKISVTRINAMMKDINNKIWVEDAPSLWIDWDGNPVNGGHTSSAILKSEHKSMRICVILGIDPKMKPRIDTGKSRPPTDQVRYIDHLFRPLDESNGSNRKDYDSNIDIRNCMAAAKQILLYLRRRFPDEKYNYNPTEFAQRIAQLPEGQVFLEKLVPYFRQIRDLLDRNDADYFKKVRFYATALILCLTEEKEFLRWAVFLAKGKNYAGETMIATCRDSLLEFCTADSSKAREDGPVRADIEKALNILYAKATKTALIRPEEFADTGRDKIVAFFIDKIEAGLKS